MLRKLIKVKFLDPFANGFVVKYANIDQAVQKAQELANKQKWPVNVYIEQSDGKWGFYAAIC